jgi:hypothetical protein
MIHEFAIEPELAATWGDRASFKYFITKFGLGEGRLVSRFPKKWKKMVWESFRSSNDMELKRLEELITRITEKMVNRSPYKWQPDKSWLNNAEDEHQQHPFYAILSRQNPRVRDYILIGDELGDSENVLWNVSRGKTVKRKAREMALAVLNMLSNCEAAIFIDPHFGPENSRYRRPLKEFFAFLGNNRGGQLPSRIEVHSSNKADPDFFRDTCKEELTKLIPKGLKVKFIQWKERTDGVKLHNRYILTDIGGVLFPNGLDEGKEQDMDDVSLLNRAQYELRWSQYAGQDPAFDLFNLIEIAGERFIK